MLLMIIGFFAFSTVSELHAWINSVFLSLIKHLILTFETQVISTIKSIK